MIHDLWYKNAIFYSLSVGSFMDADGDGVGDFEGLKRRLDYLQGLGVTAVWLMPFMPSPRRDHGYDVADYYGVDPRYGTLGDFAEFAHAARQHGMRVVIDLVINHTSDEHRWFRQARADRRSKYRDWYIWSDKPPEEPEKGTVFPGVQETTWTRDDTAGAWYFHRFFHFQPDLNMSNPDVQAELLKIMGFWLEMGVTGFRLDAVPFIIHDAGSQLTEDESQYDILRRFRSYCQWRRGDVGFLAEANVPPDKSREYFGPRGDRMHMMFNFWLNQRLFYALATADARPLAQAIHDTGDLPAPSQWVNFLRNHDELDLGRLSAERRRAVYDAFGPEPCMQLYGRGIRRRLAPMLNGDRRRMELAFSLMLTMPGTPVIYYGDEIGMGDDLDLPERDAVRTPMQWSSERCGGFTRAETPVHPVIAEGEFGFHKVNVADQRRNPGSFLNWLERMLRMRKECPEASWGRPQVVETGCAAVLAVRYDWLNNALLFLHNLSDRPQGVTFSPGPNGTSNRLVNLLADDHSTPFDGARHHVMLAPHGYRWFRLGGLDEVQRRREM